MPKIMPHLLRIKCGLLKNVFIFPKKNSLRGQRVGTVSAFYPQEAVK